MGRGAAGGRADGSYFGQLLGAESVLLLSIGLVLISTLPWVEEWFDGIDRAAIWHRRVAITGLRPAGAAHRCWPPSPDGTALGGPLGAIGAIGLVALGAVGDPAALAVGRAAAAARPRARRPRRAARPRRAPDASAATSAGARCTARPGCSSPPASCTACSTARRSTARRCCAGATSRSAAIGLAFYVYRELLARLFLSLHDYQVADGARDRRRA